MLQGAARCCKLLKMLAALGLSIRFGAQKVVAVSKSQVLHLPLTSTCCWQEKLPGGWRSVHCSTVGACGRRGRHAAWIELSSLSCIA